MLDSALKNRSRTPFLLGAATTLLGILLWSQLSAPAPAYAQLPDSAAQRNEMVQELRAMNGRLAEITGLLREIRDDARQKGAQKPEPKGPPPPR